MNAAALLKLLLKQPRPTGAAPTAKAPGAESFQALLKAAGAAGRGSVGEAGRKQSEIEQSVDKSDALPGAAAAQVMAASSGVKRSASGNPIRGSIPQRAATPQTTMTPLRERAVSAGEAPINEIPLDDSTGEVSMPPVNSNSAELPSAARQAQSNNYAAVPASRLAERKVIPQGTVPTNPTAKSAARIQEGLAVTAAPKSTAQGFRARREAIDPITVSNSLPRSAPDKLVKPAPAIEQNAAGKARRDASAPLRAIPRPQPGEAGLPDPPIAASAGRTGKPEPHSPSSIVVERSTIRQQDTGRRPFALRSDVRIAAATHHSPVEETRIPRTLVLDASRTTTPGPRADSPLNTHGNRSLHAALTSATRTDQPAVHDSPAYGATRRAVPMDLDAHRAESRSPAKSETTRTQTNSTGNFPPRNGSNAPGPGQEGIARAELNPLARADGRAPLGQPPSLQRVPPAGAELKDFWQAKLSPPKPAAAARTAMQQNAGEARAAGPAEAGTLNPAAQANKSEAHSAKGRTVVASKSSTPQYRSPSHAQFVEQVPTKLAISGTEGTRIQPARSDNGRIDTVHPADIALAARKVGNEAAAARQSQPSMDLIVDAKSPPKAQLAASHQGHIIGRFDELRSATIASVSEEYRGPRANAQPAAAGSRHTSFWGLTLQQSAETAANSKEDADSRSVPERAESPNRSASHLKAEIRERVAGREASAARALAAESSIKRENIAPMKAGTPAARIAEPEHSTDTTTKRQDAVSKKPDSPRRMLQDARRPLAQRAQHPNTSAHLDAGLQPAQAVRSDSTSRSMVQSAAIRQQPSAGISHAAHPASRNHSAVPPALHGEPLRDTSHSARDTSGAQEHAKLRAAAPDPVIHESRAMTNSDSMNSKSAPRVSAPDHVIRELRSTPIHGMTNNRPAPRASSENPATTYSRSERRIENSKVADGGLARSENQAARYAAKTENTDRSQTQEINRPQSPALRKPQAGAPSGQQAAKTGAAIIAHAPKRRAATIADRREMSGKNPLAKDSMTSPVERNSTGGARLSYAAEAQATNQPAARQSRAAERTVPEMSMSTPREDSGGIKARAGTEHNAPPSVPERGPLMTPNAGAPLSDLHPVRPRLTAQQVFELQTLTARALESMRPLGNAGNITSFVWNTEQWGSIRFRVSAARDAVQIEIESGRADVAGVLEEGRAAVERLISDQGMRVERFDVRLTRDETSSGQAALSQFGQRSPERHSATRAHAENPRNFAVDIEPERAGVSRRPLVANYEWVA